MLWKGFQRPKRIEANEGSLTPTYGRFSAQPFERGFATTIGNAMRRCLLSSIEGAAVTAIQIDGVLHEFSSLAGVVEDVTDIILNLKQIPMRLHTDEPRILTVDVKGPGVVKSSELDGDPQVEICDNDLPIATLNEEGHLKMQVRINPGRGYVSADSNFDESMGIGWIPVDSVHSPVRRVNFKVESARVGRTTDYERLILDVWTDGTISPQDAMSLSATLLKNHLTIFIESEVEIADEDLEDETSTSTELEGILATSIDELDLSVRSANCLKNADIHTLHDLVSRSEREMLETKNFGKKSLDEVQELLARFGLEFGMAVPPVSAPAAQ